MNLRPVTRSEARIFIAATHRHSRPPVQWIAAVGLEQGGVLIGVATLERPKARALCDGTTAEVSRVCTDGSRNACSVLYGALARAAAALGYRRLVTFTLAGESGSSLRASGFSCVGPAGARSWDLARHRAPRLFPETASPTVARVRWERAL